MASQSERKPKLKICIDNTEPVDEMEEGEVDDSEEEDLRRNVRPNKSAFSSRTEKSRLELVQQRPLPSPVVSDEEVLTVDMDDLETFGVTKKKPKPKVYENPAHAGFDIGFDLNSEDAVKKKNGRAKRFGIAAEETSVLDDQDLKKLYESLKVAAPDNGSDERGLRFEAIHLRGTANMSTEDVFQYFQGYLPKSVEWIDDGSCNVIWSDKVAAARAVLGMSEDPSSGKEDSAKPPAETRQKSDDQADGGQTKEENEELMEKEMETEPVDKEAEPQETEGIELFEEEEDDELNLMSSDEEMEEKTKAKTTEKTLTMVTSQKQAEKMEASDEDSDHSDKETSHKRDQKAVHTEMSKVTMETPVVLPSSNTKLMKRILPPGNWRIGKPSEKAKFLFMRFATKADKKLPGAEQKSQYYREYGNPNYGGMTGLISASRKRKLRSTYYRKEQQEAEKFVRKTQRYRHAIIPEETSFDEHLRLAKKAKKLLSDGDHDDGYGKRQYYGGSDYDENYMEEEDDLSSYWAEVEEKNEFELGKAKREDEMDMERELGELMKKAPSYRYGRMYADDLEDQMKAKRDAAQLMTFEVVDDVISTANRRTGTDSQQQHHHRDETRQHPKHSKRHHRHSDQEEEETVAVVHQPQQTPERRERLRVHRDKSKRGDLRSQIEQKKGRKKERHRHKEQGGRQIGSVRLHSDKVEVELELGVSDEDEDILEQSETGGGFRYEKLRIQVDPDDV